jgi:hypothetical protein
LLVYGYRLGCGECVRVLLEPFRAEKLLTNEVFIHPHVGARREQ